MSSISASDTNDTDSSYQSSTQTTTYDDTASSTDNTVTTAQKTCENVNTQNELTQDSSQDSETTQIKSNIKTANKDTSTTNTTKSLKQETQKQSSIYISTTGSDTNSGTKSSPKATIKNALKNVASGGSIYLSQGTYYESGIYIDKSVAIIGADAKNTIINSNNAHTFTIANDINVKLQSLTITNAKDTNGAIIYNRGSLKLQSVKLSYSEATNNGGAIYNKATLRIYNSNFTQNTATRGGAIYNEGTLTTSGCIYTYNKAYANGGAVYNKGTLTQTKDTYKYNTAKNGAGTYNTGKSTLNKISYAENTVSNLGGAIFSSGKIVLSSSNITKNSQTAIYLENKIKNFIKNTRFIENKGINGAAIFNNAILELSGSYFKTNKVTQYGGAIYNKGTLTSVSNKFLDGYAKKSGGAIYNKATLYVKSNNFESNIAKEDGGAIYDAGKLTVKISKFTLNKATSNGGAIYTLSTSTTLDKNTYISNYAKQKGGAIYNYKGTLTVINSIIINNSHVDIYNAHGNVVAKCDWWGTNSKPTSTRRYNTNVQSRIILTVKAPSSVNVNSSGTVTVSFNNKYDGKQITSYNSKDYLPSITTRITVNGGGISKKYIKDIAGSYSVTNKFTKEGTVTTSTYTQSTTITNKTTIKDKTTPITGLFVQIGASVTSSTVKKWVSAGITDVYVQARASTNNVAKLKTVINLCKNTNIRVHAWVICFYTNNGFDISTTQQNMIKNFISSVVKINGISGVCLDYVRYSGTDTSIVNPTKITNFVKAVNNIVKSKNKNLVVSACVFAEKSGTKTYYGQDYAALSPYVDVMLPMAYKYDYNSGRSWLKDVTSYVVKQAKYSQVVTVLQTYKYSSGSGVLSATELTNDAKAVMSAGSDGYCLFRYGLINNYPTSASKLA